MKYFIYIIIVLVTIAIIAGFFVVGSPQQERLRRFDEKRVQDLQTIQWQIVNYWTSKSMLPQTIHDLDDNISGFTAPHDPVTESEYDYQIKSNENLIFELCANFDTSNLGETTHTTQPRPAYPFASESDSWQHDAGRQCFERKIDPQLYPPKTPPVK